MAGNHYGISRNRFTVPLLVDAASHPIDEPIIIRAICKVNRGNLENNKVMRARIPLGALVLY
jgi:hypothetical protein